VFNRTNDFARRVGWFVACAVTRAGFAPPCNRPDNKRPPRQMWSPTVLSTVASIRPGATQPTSIINPPACNTCRPQWQHQTSKGLHNSQMSTVTSVRRVDGQQAAQRGRGLPGAGVAENGWRQQPALAISGRVEP